MPPMANQDAFYRWSNLEVSLTSLCNLRCVMCPVIRREHHTLSREQALSIADFAQARGFQEVMLNGGEPTLVPYFWELIDRLADAGLKISVLSNATRFTLEDIARLARIPRLAVNTSIDGPPEVHDEIRGVPGCFEKTETAIHSLLEAGVAVGINTVIQRRNWHLLMDIYRLFENDALAWHGFSFAETYYAQENVPPEKVQSALDALRDIQRRDEAGLRHASLSEALLHGYAMTQRYPRVTMHPGRDCPIPRRHLLINNDGEVFPCGHYPWYNHERRRLQEQSLDEIVDSKERQDLIKNVVGPHGCTGCSTTCYVWDDDFRERLLQPNFTLRARLRGLYAKEALRNNHPGLFGAAKKANALLNRVRRSLGL